MKTSTWCVCVLLLVGTTVGKRFGGGGGSRRGGSTYKHRTPSPPPPPPPSHTSSHGSGSSGTFLNAERAGSPGGTTHNRGSPFSNPPPPQTNGPVGFERFGGAGTSGGSHQIGFDKVNSQANKPNSYNPSAPPGPVGPPPAYPGSHSTGNFGGNDHPPAYPGRPINAPPSYTPTNQHFQGQQFGNGVPHQNQFGNPSHGNPGYGNPSYGNPSYGNPSYGNPGFGSPNYGSYQGFGSPTYGGGTFGGGGYHPNNYQGNTYGGSPFGGGGYNGNPYYSPNNFGYSNNPGYFGGGGYPGQYDYHKKSRFGGLPIPIPIPIPIPFGGGFGGGFGGLGGYHSHSYNHRVLDTFIKDSNTSSSGNSSTSVFLLNNATVTPCTTDHFVYDTVKVTTMACTALSCTAVKVLTRTNVSAVETVHGGSVTLCLEGGNATVSSHGEIITPVVSEIKRESLTVCRNVTAATNKTSEEATTTAEPATTTFAPETTTVEVTSTASVSSGNTTVCEVVNCSSVEMCLPAVELVDACTAESCPFRRTGYKPCVVVKMCSAPSAPVSTFATLNTTISKIDEYNRHQSVNDVANLTLISYHPPVTTSFNTSSTSFNTSTTSFNTSTTTPAP